MKTKLILIFISFFFLLTFNAFAKYQNYNCFSQDAAGHYTKVDEYKKKIEESKNHFKTLIQLEFYDVLISELNTIVYCYECSLERDSIPFGFCS